MPNNKQNRFFDIGQEKYPITVSAGQTEYRPLIFLPRDNDDGYDESENEGNDISIQSHHIVVHSAIVRAKTSDGTVYSPFRALSILSNPYGLPPSVHFEGFFIDESENYETSHSNNNSNGPLEIIETKWEYDLYLNNPSEGKLHVFEMFTSDPDWIEIQVLDHLAEDLYGPIEIQPLGRIYIGSIIVKSTNILTSLADQNNNGYQIDDTVLVGGYLYIRTNLDELVVPIDVKLTGVVTAIERTSRRKKARSDQYESHAENKQKNDSSSETTGNLEGSEDLHVSKSTEPDEDNIDDIPDLTQFEITYDKEAFYFSTRSISLTGDRTVASDNEKHKPSSGFHRLFKKKGHSDEMDAIEDINTRSIIFTNNCTQNLTIVSMTISSPECEQWFQLNNIEVLEGLNAEPGQPWVTPGTDVTLTYFGNFSSHNLLPYISCSLLLKTSISSHEIPIILYGNELLITAERDTLPPPCQNSHNENKDTILDIRECSTQWWDSSFLKDEVKSSLSQGIDSTPLLFNFGAIPAGEISARSIMLTNLNPIPITVSSMKSSMEGMEISLGRTTARVIDYIPTYEREVWEHPFFPELGWKNDVKFSSIANENLRDSFIKYGIIELFRDANRPSPSFDLTNCSRSIDGEQGGLLISLDGRHRKTLRHSSPQKPKFWSIPPGAVARFDVYIRAPPREALSKDITSFAASGLQLKTDTATLDLMISFDTLLGKLDLSPKNSELAFDIPANSHDESLKIVRKVPPGKALRIPPYLRPNEWSKSQLQHRVDSSNIELLLSSSFSNDMKLYDLESCNRWFSVTTNRTDADETIPIRALENSLPVGYITSSISCEENNFYACAIDWLENSSLIQPLGCGLDHEINGNNENFSESILEIKTKFLSTLKEAANYISSIYSLPVASASQEETLHSKVLSAKKLHTVKDDGKGNNISSKGKNHKDNISKGLVSKSVILKIEKAIDAWRQISLHNINRISTVILAKTNHGNGKNDAFLTSVPALYAETELLLPNLNTLVNSTLDFGVNRVSSTTHEYITVSNPTAIPLRVRLASPQSSDLFVQQYPDALDSWWTGNNFWMPDGKGNVLQSHHNMTFKSGGGAHVSLVNPSLHASNSFILGCGKRCGLRNEVGDSLKTAIGASSVQGSTSDLYADSAPAFALGYRSLAEAEIPAFGKARLGPVHFRPTARSEYTSEIYLQNSLTGLEKVHLRGTGGLERLIFLHNDLEQRVGRPALVFSGSAEKYDQVVEKPITLANTGDLSVDIKRVYISTSEIIHYSMIKPFPKSGVNSHVVENKHRCEEHGFRLVGCDVGDFSTPGASHGLGFRIQEKLFSMFSKSKNRKKKETSTHFDNEEITKNTFTLHPGQNKTIPIEHMPDCTFRTVYVSLNVEYQNLEMNWNKQREVENQKVDILMGYDMSPIDMATCSSVSSGSWMSFRNVMLRRKQSMTTVLVCIFTCSYVLLVIYWLVSRYSYAFNFRGMLSINQVSYPSKKYISATDSPFPCVGSSTWTAPLLCLAKTDPSSQELIALGKEQTKQILLSRYKTLGISTNGDFARQRMNRGNNLAHATKKSNSGMPRDILPLTDLIYGPFEQMNSDDMVPSGLGWRFAASSSIIPPLDRNWNWTMEETESSGVNKVNQLLQRRAKQATTTQDKDTSSKRLNISEKDSSRVNEEESDEDDEKDGFEEKFGRGLNKKEFHNDVPTSPKKTSPEVTKDVNITKTSPTSFVSVEFKEDVKFQSNIESTQRSTLTNQAIREHNEEPSEVTNASKKASYESKANGSKILSKKDKIHHSLDMSKSPSRKKSYDSNR